MGDERGQLTGQAAEPVRPASRRSARRRILVLVVLVGTVFAGARLAGLDHALTPDHLRALLPGTGIGGILLFVLAFSLGLLAQLPGLLFVAVAVLAYGKAVGALVALGGAVVAVSVSFVVVRHFGGSALTEIESPLLRRLLSQLDTRPLRSVILLRVVFGVAPVLNYTLALSSLGFRDYLIGSVIGMAAPITVAAVLLDVAL